VQLEGALRQEAPHEQLANWARQLSMGRAGDAVGHPVARLVLDCLSQADDTLAQKHVLQTGDFETYLSWLRSGTLMFPLSEDIMIVPMSVDAIHQRMAGTRFRIFERGLGWIQFARFASPHTGRVFLAGARVEEESRSGIKTLPDSTSELVLADAKRTLF